MQITDIRPIKQKLRAHYKQLRRELPEQEKRVWDQKIEASVRRLWQYKKCDTLLCYVSTDIEVDTKAIIRHALEDGKRVAVPRCIPGTCRMEFYYIRSHEELSPGMFGVPEPPEDPQNLLTDRSKGLCIVPALCYDRNGYRLGYGKGYYDRYLSDFGGTVIGICYSNCIERQLPHGRFDRPVETIVTEKYIRHTGTPSMNREKFSRGGRK